MNAVNILDGKYVKVGDTDPDLRVQLIDDDVPRTLSGFTATLTLKGANTGNKPVDEASMSKENISDGIVRYSWQAGDTDIAEVYEAEITIDDGAGTVITFPNQGTFTVHIQPKL